MGLIAIYHLKETEEKGKIKAAKKGCESPQTEIRYLPFRGEEIPALVEYEPEDQSA